MVFLGRWILDVGSLDELDSKDKFRFSGSVLQGSCLVSQDLGTIGFSGSGFLVVGFSGSWIRALTLWSNVFRRIKVEVD